MNAIYFAGDSKRDPGFYCNGHGPYPTAQEAEMEEIKQMLPIKVRKRESIPIIRFKTESEKFLIKSKEDDERPRISLAVSLYVLTPIIVWYGVYKITVWSLS